MNERRKISDSEIEEALILCKGQPTKVAEMLNVSYVTIWRRINDNPELEMVKQAYRAQTFNEVSTLNAKAVIEGVIKQPVMNESKKEVKRDREGNIIYKEVAVPVSVRMQYAHLLSNLYKTDEGIKDKLEITNTNEIDLSEIDTETLNKLAEIGERQKGDRDMALLTT